MRRRRDRINGPILDSKTQRQEDSEDYFERHPSRLQFITNIILVVLTVGTLSLTWFYSNKNLKLSTLQYKSANDQFNYQRHLDRLRNISDSIKERAAARRYTKDSLIQERKDSIQIARNKNQDSLNVRQLNINNQQLIAAKSQAQTLKNQLNEQTKQYREQFFERRPYFTVENVNID